MDSVNILKNACSKCILKGRSISIVDLWHLFEKWEKEVHDIDISDLPTEYFIYDRSLKLNKLEQSERDIIVSSLVRNKYNQKEACKELGITTRAINHRIHKYKIICNKWRLNK